MYFKSEKEEFFSMLGKLALIPVIILYDAFAWGFVIFKCCHWFLPVIGMKEVISYHAAIAINLLLCVGKASIKSNSDAFIKGVKMESELNYSALAIGPWFTLGIMYICSLFV